MSKVKVVSAVHLFLQNEQQELLLARRYNTGYQDGNYSLVAGHIEEGETPTQAMCREALEEAGIIITEKELQFSHVMYRRRERATDPERIDFFFVCTQWSGTPTMMEPDKCDALLWALPQELPKNMVPYVANAIEQMVGNQIFSEFGWETNTL